mgnify:CR=1 FL=1
MTKLMLIGGGEVGRGNTTYETKEIDEEIVKMTEKTNPVFLFIGLASSFSDSYYDTMKKNYNKLGCTSIYLKKKNIINNPQIVKEKIEKADIIYIGGGDTIKLLDDIKNYKIDRLLIEAYQRGCVLAGLSAGAILLAKEGFSDSLILRKESKHYAWIKGLSLTNICICPHYHSTNEKTNELKKSLKENPKNVYSLENGTALKITDKKIEVIKAIKNNKVYQCSYHNKYQEREIVGK